MDLCIGYAFGHIYFIIKLLHRGIPFYKTKGFPILFPCHGYSHNYINFIELFFKQVRLCPWIFKLLLNKGFYGNHKNSSNSLTTPDSNLHLVRNQHVYGDASHKKSICWLLGSAKR